MICSSRKHLIYYPWGHCFPPALSRQPHIHTDLLPQVSKANMLHFFSTQDCHTGRIPGLSKLSSKIRITESLRLVKPLEIKSTKEVQGEPDDWVQWRRWQLWHNSETPGKISGCLLIEYKNLKCEQRLVLLWLRVGVIPALRHTALVWPSCKTTSPSL